MRTELISFTASMLINAGILFSFDRATVHYDQLLTAQQQRIEKQSADSLSFEFVEAPPKVHARRPAKTRKISDRDAVNQDLTRDKSSAEGPPHVETEGPADQLAQKRMKPSAQSAKASPEIAEKLPVVQKTETEKSQKEMTPPSDFISQRPSPKVLPSTPVRAQRGLIGRDRINTFEVSKERSHGAQLYGITAFEATGSGMGQYMKNLKEKIWMAWFPYLVVHYPKDFKTADAIVNFKLNAQGEVKIVELVENKGSPLFAAFCMESVQRAGSFGPLPQEILDLVGKEELEIKFAFHYW